MILNAHERILGAALRVFEEHGMRGATTRRIADAAEVNEVTLFRHFGSKEKLLREALEWASVRLCHHAMPVLPADPVDPRRELTEWCRAHLQLIHERRMFIRTTMAEFEENPDVTQCGAQIPLQVSNGLHGYIERLQAVGMALPECDVSAATALLMGAVFSDAMSRDITPKRFPYSLDEAAEKYVTLFVRAIGVPEESAVRDRSEDTVSGEG